MSCGYVAQFWRNYLGEQVAEDTSLDSTADEAEE